MSKINNIKEFAVLTKTTAFFQAVVLMVLWILEIAFPDLFSGTALGFLMGSIVVIINLQILGKGWASLILFSKGAVLAFASMLLSLLFLGITAFWIFQKFPSSLMGFALGFACLPISGFLYAYQLLKQEQDELNF